MAWLKSSKKRELIKEYQWVSSKAARSAMKKIMRKELLRLLKKYSIIYLIITTLFLSLISWDVLTANIAPIAKGIVIFFVFLCGMIYLVAVKTPRETHIRVFSNNDLELWSGPSGVQAIKINKMIQQVNDEVILEAKTTLGTINLIVSTEIYENLKSLESS